MRFPQKGSCDTLLVVLGSSERWRTADRLADRLSGAIVAGFGTVPARVAPGRDEIADLAAEQERADVLCEFCRDRYEFGREELERILTQRGEGKPPGES
jgi:hypothetical protein